jgi:hypothetical protein
MRTLTGSLDAGTLWRGAEILTTSWEMGDQELKWNARAAKGFYIITGAGQRDFLLRMEMLISACQSASNKLLFGLLVEGGAKSYQCRNLVILPLR